MVKLRAYTSAMPLDEGMIQVRILSGVPKVMPLWTNWQSRFSQKEECSRFDSEQGYQNLVGSKRDCYRSSSDIDRGR